MKKEIKALNDELESLSGFIANQKSQISLQIGTNNRIKVIKDLICGTSNPTRNKAVRISEIASSKLQCATFSGVNPSKFEYNFFWLNSRIALKQWSAKNTN